MLNKSPRKHIRIKLQNLRLAFCFNQRIVSFMEKFDHARTIVWEKSANNDPPHEEKVMQINDRKEKKMYSAAEMIPLLKALILEIKRIRQHIRHFLLLYKMSI
jgi:hypothetical protein